MKPAAVKNLTKPLPLTPREREVLAAWGQHPDPSELAALLGISVHTVLTHLKRGRKKLGVRRTVEGWQQLEKH